LCSHPKFRLSIWLRGRLAAQAVGLRQLTKAGESPSFRKSAELKRHFLSGVPLGGPKFSGFWFG
jgi:hypothetical protein